MLGAGGEGAGIIFWIRSWIKNIWDGIQYIWRKTFFFKGGRKWLILFLVVGLNKKTNFGAGCRIFWGGVTFFAGARQ